MRTGNTSRRANETDFLSALDGLTFGDERFAQMEITRHHAAAVIDVHNVTGEEEIVDERDNPAVGSTHGSADTAAEIDAEVSACHHAIEGTA